jgi:hypothetical protein
MIFVQLLKLRCVDKEIYFNRKWDYIIIIYLTMQ